ncbi:MULTISPECIES: 50S ribosomal protein L3 [Pseudoalteromonas]|uniref:Large ribosomal subunit protein uL3 n=1 Tax=Pseudoalteromonas ruthenica TaxID=151081 RepID=A0A0F4PIM0_9GAMM|nr:MULTISPECIES: 50S ribosomal protein L3 [Pseudoalteromonas]KJY95365.1 50S ribosomal protein L3 [Pseudoalteromonas ruthenica]KJY96210.1 50S ribosomal protein L3 [Pseudoalteromonas ruthenica]MCF2863984.1 50S ribosomal protein L3 [Pseudoalteromonas sp. CNAT2-18]MCG7545880.1 50S ribosomal protein L3 [Pseudoalteromonas sp. MM17-2]MCG7559871.1 50S ribosomal protein L3 [Pseudoalteromonas sp. CNAT2-18.1]
MALGLVGRKVGMTRIFTEDGVSIPVTVIEATPNRVTQIKSDETDGYNALQVTAGEKKASRVNKPAAGHFAKAGVEAGRGLWEFRLNGGEGDFEVGSEITVDVFNEVKKVDVTGTSKGKGFQGGVKRWNFSMQDATHGNSISHRAPGSIGQNQSPGKVFKGKKMAGQMGNVQSTTQNLELVRVDAERNLLLVKGAVPGAIGGDVIVKPAVKA